MASRLKIIEHGIVLADFTNVDTDDAVTVLKDAQAFIRERPRDGSMLLLTDVTGTGFDQRVMSAMREFAMHNKPYVRASAVIGMTTIQRIITRALSAMTSREIRICETREEAIAYLLSRAGPRAAR